MKKTPKHKGLIYTFHYSHAREFVDVDYVDKLSEEEQEWLANFLDSYYSGRFKKEEEKNPIKDRKECYNRANKQKRDIMSRFKSRINLNNDGANSTDVMDLAAWDLYKMWKGEEDDID